MILNWKPSEMKWKCRMPAQNPIFLHFLHLIVGSWFMRSRFQLNIFIRFKLLREQRWWEKTRINHMFVSLTVIVCGSRSLTCSFRFLAYFIDNRTKRVHIPSNECVDLVLGFVLNSPKSLEKTFRAPRLLNRNSVPFAQFKRNIRWWLQTILASIGEQTFEIFQIKGNFMCRNRNRIVYVRVCILLKIAVKRRPNHRSKLIIRIFLFEVFFFYFLHPFSSESGRNCCVCHIIVVC